MGFLEEISALGLGPRQEADLFKKKRQRMYQLLDEQAVAGSSLGSQEDFLGSPYRPSTAGIMKAKYERMGDQPARRAATAPAAPGLDLGGFSPAIRPGPHLLTSAGLSPGMRSLVPATPTRGDTPPAISFLPAAQSSPNTTQGSISRRAAVEANASLRKSIQDRLDGCYGYDSFYVKRVHMKKGKVQTLTVELDHEGLDPLIISATYMSPPDEDVKVEIECNEMTLTWRLKYWMLVTQESWIGTVDENRVRVQYDGWEDACAFSGNSHLPIFMVRECFEMSNSIYTLEDFHQMVMLCIMDLNLPAGKHQHGWLLLETLYLYGERQCKELSIKIGSHGGTGSTRRSNRSSSRSNKGRSGMFGGKSLFPAFDLNSDPIFRNSNSNPHPGPERAATPDTLRSSTPCLDQDRSASIGDLDASWNPSTALSSILTSPAADGAPTGAVLPVVPPLGQLPPNVNELGGVNVEETMTKSALDDMLRPNSYRRSFAIHQILRFNGQDGEISLTPKEADLDGLVDAIMYNVSIKTLRLRCIANFLPVDKCLKTLWSAFPMNNSIECLDISYQGLSKVGMEWLAKGLALAKTLTSLDLTGNRLGDAGSEFDGAHYLAEVVKNSIFLHRVKASGNNIGPKGGEKIAGALATNRSITDMDLSDNPLGDDCGEKLAKGLMLRNKTLQHIRLKGTGIGERTMEAFGMLLSGTGSQLLELDLRDNPKARPEALAMDLERNTSLTDLKLDGGGSSIHQVMWALQKNAGLRSLALCNVVLDSNATYNLECALQSNTTLQEIDYHLERGMEPSNPTYLNRMVAAMELNQSLTKLNMRGQQIGPMLPTLYQSMLKCPIVSLDLSCCALHETPGTVAVLRDIIRTNNRLTYLDISRNRFGDALVDFAPALLANNTLIHLDLSHTKMHDSTIRHLAVELRANYKLKFLGIEGNDEPLHPMTRHEIKNVIGRNASTLWCKHGSLKWHRRNQEHEQARSLQELVCADCQQVMATRTIVDKDGTRKSRFKKRIEEMQTNEAVRAMRVTFHTQDEILALPPPVEEIHEDLPEDGMVDGPNTAVHLAHPSTPDPKLD
uniref:Uncharacterized protein n=1 Tax=Eutreptiella gymnastica TaxID=73025 RepID=A0A7S1I4I6_9EUGL|mmetsp:Transcript_129678/g.224121  ORF Transcript_129678/g.224121 Transcript_129678/m.224121 type:complete len:1070 (+) Transcript_129678:107-3316(+)